MIRKPEVRPPCDYQFAADNQALREVAELKNTVSEVECLNDQLEELVAQRTAEFQAANEELECLCYSVSHDLRSPLRIIDGFSQSLLEDYGDTLDATAHDRLHRVRAASQRMGRLIDEVLALARLTRGKLRPQTLDLSGLVRAIATDHSRAEPTRRVRFVIEDGLAVHCDPELMRTVVQNLIGNAWKFTSDQPRARIEFGTLCGANGHRVFMVRDNGTGFDMAHAGKLFRAFESLHGNATSEGSGIGLAAVERAVKRHGGRVWAQGAVGQGATFYFTLGPTPD